jgi:hypothetical protein
MKNAFYEFYKLDEDKIRSIWDKGILVVDTNVLLDLYRLASPSREDLKKSIKYFKDRIWLPYQVGLEFHRNREKVIKDLGDKTYQDFNDTIEQVTQKALESFKIFHRHPCIKYNDIEKIINRAKDDLKRKSDNWKGDYHFSIDNDDILKWVTETFDNKIGEEETLEQLLAIYEKGATRYAAKIPPGYKDKDNKGKKEEGERYLYGDLIIWWAVINKAKQDNVDIVFITNDNKEDWYEKEKGETKGPRYELLREFHKETSRDILIMSESAFLNEIKERTEVKVKPESIEDAKRALANTLLLNVGEEPLIYDPRILRWVQHLVDNPAGVMANLGQTISPTITGYKNPLIVEGWPNDTLQPRLIDPKFFDPSLGEKDK